MNTSFSKTISSGIGLLVIACVVAWCLGCCQIAAESGKESFRVQTERLDMTLAEHERSIDNQIERLAASKKAIQELDSFEKQLDTRTNALAALQVQIQQVQRRVEDQRKALERDAALPGSDRLELSKDLEGYVQQLSGS